MTGAPSGPLFSYYGDDFTGSTDALEALAANGLQSVLFLQPPAVSSLRAFPGCRAVGIAGDSRSRSPEWMRRELPGIFASLREIGAPIVQYKVCSTFDSSPETGSIGCALEVGQDVFEADFVPVVAAAPHLRRYVLFGHLFAAEGERVYRIDRHPAMQRHPVTPMGESDLLLHLRRQTDRTLELMDFEALSLARPQDALLRLLRHHPDAILFDGLDDATQLRTARLIWQNRHMPQTFVVGSSGFTHAMAGYWRRRGWVEPPQARSGIAGADRLVVLSGSCSPATHRQICHALRSGFAGIALDPAAWKPDAVLKEAERCLAARQSVVLYSALGPSTVREIADRTALAAEMGDLLGDLIRRTRVRRVVIAGGDTASHAVRRLGIDALTFAASTAPGAPLCRTHSAAHEWNGLELVLKGGQVGPDQFFEDVLRGAPKQET